MDGQNIHFRIRSRHFSDRLMLKVSTTFSTYSLNSSRVNSLIAHKESLPQKMESRFSEGLILNESQIVQFASCCNSRFPYCIKQLKYFFLKINNIKGSSASGKEPFFTAAIQSQIGRNLHYMSNQTNSTLDKMNNTFLTHTVTPTLANDLPTFSDM